MFAQVCSPPLEGLQGVCVPSPPALGFGLSEEMELLLDVFLCFYRVPVEGKDGFRLDVRAITQVARQSRQIA